MLCSISTTSKRTLVTALTYFYDINNCHIFGRGSTQWSVSFTDPTVAEIPVGIRMYG